MEADDMSCLINELDKIDHCFGVIHHTIKKHDENSDVFQESKRLWNDFIYLKERLSLSVDLKPAT